MERAAEKRAMVYTVKDLCRVCYTCVRECPVKAIRMVDGQAEVVPELCIACGNCTIVCSQGAKVYQHSTDRVAQLLRGQEECMALSTIQLQANLRNISVRFVGDPVFCQSDPSDMDILFNNLLSNAVKYNREGGRSNCRCSGRKRGWKSG